MTTNTEESIVEEIRIADHVSTWHKAFVANRSLWHTLASEQLLGEHSHGHCGLDNVLPKAFCSVGAWEPARESSHCYFWCFDLATSRARYATASASSHSAFYSNLVAFVLELGKVTQSLKSGMRVDIHDRDRQAILSRKLCGHLRSERRVTAKIEEILLWVNHVDGKTEHLCPDRAYDASCANDVLGRDVYDFPFCRDHLGLLQHLQISKPLKPLPI
mmetsp:Transcript_105411/g.187477  ORF Transcript_105411/g.187477 Transcript_105411/m.187477 type:complete len:217 (+) Transcript_105411:340-990(+)